jgi:hypothetical protein
MLLARGCVNRRVLGCTDLWAGGLVGVSGLVIDGRLTIQ